MSTTITNSDDIIDSRDVIARIEELEGERDEYVSNATTGDDWGALAGRGVANNDPSWGELADRQAHAEKAWAEEFPDDAEELATLRALAEEGEGYSDWHHGATLIRDSYFEDYARELADDIGATNHELSWPYTCIDWEQAARELQMDYTSIDFDGVDYWIR